MIRRPQTTLAIVAVLAACGIGIRAWKAGGPGETRENDSRPVAESPASLPKPAGGKVSAAFASLGAGSGKDETRQSLTDLRKSLVEMPKEEALAAIRGFLASGEDRVTGLSFVIARDGSLTEWPSFRTFLLDVVSTVDPTAAAAIGREILATPTSADEWALALRNVGRGEEIDGSAAFLQSKTEQLIANPAWQAQPSIGYLNAFDVLVHIGATGSTPLLSELIQRKDRKDLAHAGFLTLDRLVQREPVDLLGRLAADRSLQQSRPEMVAQQFARADVRDAGQREILRTWLLDPARTSAELRSFAGVYPNNNRFVSNNLLTVESAQSGGDLAAHDRAALETVRAWAADAAFEPVREHLVVMLSRLREFVGDPENPPASDSPASNDRSR
jgi:hypothetical protein